MYKQAQHETRERKRTQTYTCKQMPKQNLKIGHSMNQAEKIKRELIRNTVGDPPPCDSLCGACIGCIRV